MVDGWRSTGGFCCRGEKSLNEIDSRQRAYSSKIYCTFSAAAQSFVTVRTKKKTLKIKTSNSLTQAAAATLSTPIRGTMKTLSNATAAAKTKREIH